MKKILFTGGGTAGHITPNIALFPFLKNNYELHYAGCDKSMEQSLIAAFPYVTFHVITAVKLERRLTMRNFTIPVKLIRGINESKKLLKELAPSVIFSKGGFASLPIMLAANKNTPCILHESDMTLGLSNRLVVKKCKYALTGFDTPLKYDNAIFTGSPLRQEIYYGDKNKINATCGFSDNGLPNLLILGGSLGSAAINNVVAASLNELTAYFNIAHIVGKKNVAPYCQKNYYATPYATNIADYYAWADFTISRGGANTLAELIALKIPSVIIPLPKGASRGDQIDNAIYYENTGCVKKIFEDSLTAGVLMSELGNLKKNVLPLKAAMARMKTDGARRIANIIMETAEKGK